MNQALGNIVMVGIGSMSGGIARFLVSKALKNIDFIALPLGTLVVNLLGCLILGFIYGLIGKGHEIPEGVRLLLTVGFCGGFTTFSTFMNDNFLLMSQSQIAGTILYTILSILGGFIFLYGGYYLSRL